MSSTEFERTVNTEQLYASFNFPYNPKFHYGTGEFKLAAELMTGERIAEQRGFIL